jgi:hypothetical protein
MSEDFEMTDMAIREYQFKISQSRDYYKNIISRLSPLIKNPDRAVSNDAKQKEAFARGELSVLSKYDEKIEKLRKKLDLAFIKRKNENALLAKSVAPKKEAIPSSPKKSEPGFLERIKSRFLHRQSKDASQVHDFKDAIAWIETYIAANEFDTGLIATRELLLKTKTEITFYIAAEKKVTVLASSNIPSVAKASTAKLKEIKKNLKALTERENTLRKNLEKIE